MAKGCPPCKQKVPGWMVTFGDLNSLLLTFFILLLATAEMNPAKLEQTIGIIMQTGGSGPYEGGNTLSKGKLAELGMTVSSLPSTQSGTRLDKALKRATSLLEPQIASKKVLIREDERGMVISLLGDTFFGPGDAQLLPETKEVLSQVALLILDMKNLMQMDNKIEIEGFADAGQINPSSPYYHRFPTNLDLASARSNNVVKYFWGSGIEPIRMYQGKAYAKFKSVSLGEFQPMEENISPEHRAYNRRVDIIILREEEGKW